MNNLTKSLVLFFLSAISVHAQNEIDSLKIILKTSTDTVRVKLLNDLAFKLAFSDTKLGEAYVQEAITLAEMLEYDKGITQGWQVLGTLHDIRGEYDKAIEAYHKGFEALKGDTLKYQNRYLTICNGMGLAYYHKGNYIEALDIFYKALEISERSGSKNIRAGNLLVNIGLVYHDQKEYTKALENYMAAFEHGKEIGNVMLTGRAANNIGIIYKELHQYDESIEYFTKSLLLKKDQNDSLGLSSTFTNLASLYAIKGDFEKAMTYVKDAERIKEGLGDKMGLVIIYDIHAEILIAQRRLREAAELMARNLVLANEVGGENKLLVYDRFYQFYSVKNDFKNALTWYIRKTEFHDSLFNEQKSRQIAQLQTLYEVNKKEKEIIKLEKEKEEASLLWNILFLSMGFFIVLITLAGILIRYRVKKKKELYEVERELHLKKLENAVLREEELRNEIEFKNKELASYTINFVQKSELMEELKRNLQSIKPQDGVVAQKINAINRLVENSYQVDREWGDFKMQFENVHHSFFKILKERCPELTNGDLKLCALLKLNMNMKEAAKVLGISPESVKTARYRLRKKFGLEQDDNLVDFILNLDNTKEQEVTIKLQA